MKSSAIGICRSENPECSAADNKVHYFDPASEAEPLRSVAAPAFEADWGRCDRAMLIVVTPAANTLTAGAPDAKETQ